MSRLGAPAATSATTPSPSAERYRPVVPREQACAEFREIYAAWKQEAAYQTAEQIADAALVPGGPTRDELIAKVHDLRARYRKQHAA